MTTYTWAIKTTGVHYVEGLVDGAQTWRHFLIGCTGVTFRLPEKLPNSKTTLSFCKWDFSNNTVRLEYNMYSIGLSLINDRFSQIAATWRSSRVTCFSENFINKHIIKKMRQAWSPIEEQVMMVMTTMMMIKMKAIITGSSATLQPPRQRCWKGKSLGRNLKLPWCFARRGKQPLPQIQEKERLTKGRPASRGRH